jgi:lipoprotein-anchoring transpeptidase ErfK/SrfK
VDATEGLAATTAFGAVVKESHLRALQQVVAADYRKTVPYKMIVVSTETQYASAYQGGKIVLTTPVTTGGPELPTDHGVFHIYMKVTPWVFHSPWPPSSPYYYPPTPITYWMPFDGGEGLHDAWWRPNFGPGSNLQPTNLGTGRYILGTHGCVNLPMSAAEFIWNWAPIGTTVVVI